MSARHEGEPLNVPVSSPEDEFITIVRGHGIYPEEVPLGIGNNLVCQRCLEALEGLECPASHLPVGNGQPYSTHRARIRGIPQAVVNTGAWIGDAVIVTRGESSNTGVWWIPLSMLHPEPCCAVGSESVREVGSERAR